METMSWEENVLKLLDQTKLPRVVEYIHCKNYLDVVHAIKRMQVRGAPAIGAAAAYGMALGALEAPDEDEFYNFMNKVKKELASTRPTAVNLFWALERMVGVLEKTRGRPVKEIREILIREALTIHQEDIAMNKRIGMYGQSLMPDEVNVLTHCNAGALATGGYGTALGVIRAAHEAGKKVRVYADETRPLLQGARLTAWELMEDNIPVTIITDNMAGYIMKKGMVNFIVVGADRIAANGDVANKIGTYSVAVLAKEHNIPFYVAAPVSTIDMSIKTGDEIPIEERGSEEITEIAGQVLAPPGVKVFNPAFDVTPNHLIKGIITDRGVVTAPYQEGLEKITGNKK